MKKNKMTTNTLEMLLRSAQKSHDGLVLVAESEIREIIKHIETLEKLIQKDGT